MLLNDNSGKLRSWYGQPARIYSRIVNADKIIFVVGQLANSSSEELCRKVAANAAAKSHHLHQTVCIMRGEDRTWAAVMRIGTVSIG